MATLPGRPARPRAEQRRTGTLRVRTACVSRVFGIVAIAKQLAAAVSVLLYPGLLDFCPSGFLSSGGSVGVHALLVCNLWAVVRSGSARNLSVLTVKLSCGLNRFGIFQR